MSSPTTQRQQTLSNWVVKGSVHDSSSSPSGKVARSQQHDEFTNNLAGAQQAAGIAVKEEGNSINGAPTPFVGLCSKTADQCSTDANVQRVSEQRPSLPAAATAACSIAPVSYSPKARTGFTPFEELLGIGFPSGNAATATTLGGCVPDPARASRSPARSQATRSPLFAVGLPKYMHSPQSLLRYVEREHQGSDVTAAMPPLISRELQDGEPPVLRIILKVFGYFPKAPYLRLLLMHFALAETGQVACAQPAIAVMMQSAQQLAAASTGGGKPDDVEKEQQPAGASGSARKRGRPPLKSKAKPGNAQGGSAASSTRGPAGLYTILRLIDALRVDCLGLVVRLNTLLREKYMASLNQPSPVAETQRPGPQEVPREVANGRIGDRIPGPSLSVAVKYRALAIDMTTRQSILNDYLKAHGPPSYVILPSSIPVANYGVYIRGRVEKDKAILFYNGIKNPNDKGLGYRIEYRSGEFIDARVERSLASMVNDSRNSPFSNNCRFAAGASRVSVRTKRACANEELFVGYGGKFSFDGPAVLSGLCSGYQPAFAMMCSSTRMPEYPRQSLLQSIEMDGDTITGASPLSTGSSTVRKRGRARDDDSGEE